MYRGEDGEVQLIGTGDPLIDKWEQELAQGLEPDLTEGMSDEGRRLLEKEKAKTKKTKDITDDLEGEIRFDKLPPRPRSPTHAPNITKRDLLGSG